MPETSGTSRASLGGGWPVRRPTASEPTKRPSRRRRRRYARGTAAIISVLSLIFASAALFSGYVPFSLSLRPVSDVPIRDNSAFGKTRVGEILFSNGWGEVCHKVEFHNDTGLLGRDTKVRCDTGQPENETTSASRVLPNTDRLTSVRNAFVKR
ncbi:hypothetical protein RA307_00825 [Xanthobacteraceae bacterium Astr-EGSB]|uniref:hypothetical protein n=1 Tax=Astrobacterium formosum TaxID=3069710 RepID=UPI0027B3806D|nr:hypothetical protein [Xanthobacteraceae bacterium Astr-EGSB]